MTSFSQLNRFFTFFAILSCKLVASLPGVVTVDRASDSADLSGYSRTTDNQRLQKKLKPSVADSTPAFSQNMTRLTVRAMPKKSTFNLSTQDIHLESEPFVAVSIRCRIKCIAIDIQDLPTVSFYLQIEKGTMLPLSSGMPGVDIFTSTSESKVQRPYKDKDDRRAVTTFRSDTHLTLDSNTYALLRPGDNSFFCRAYSPSTGIQKSDEFVVHRF